MKKLTTTMMQETLNKQNRHLTVGLDLGDRASFYCVLDEAGEVLLEQKVSTTPEAIKEIFERRYLEAVSHWRPGHTHHG
jgi:transposase